MLTPAQESWLKALESDEFKQTHATLEAMSGGCCCLGVACKLAEKAGVFVKVDNGRVWGVNLSDQHAVFEWIGLKNACGDPYPASSNNDGMEPLTTLNDSGKTFKEIAQIIRNNPDAYFKPGIVAQGS